MTTADAERLPRPHDRILEAGRQRLQGWLAQAERDARGILADSEELRDSIDGVLEAFRPNGTLTWAHLDALTITALPGQPPFATLLLKGQVEGVPTAIRWPGSEPGKAPEQIAYEVLVFAAVKILSDQAELALQQAAGKSVAVFGYGSFAIEVPLDMVRAALEISGTDELVEAQRDHMLRGTIEQVRAQLGQAQALAAWVAMSPQNREALYVRLSVLLVLGVNRIDPVEGVAA